MVNKRTIKSKRNINSKRTIKSKRNINNNKTIKKRKIGGTPPCYIQLLALNSKNIEEFIKVKPCSQPPVTYEIRPDVYEYGDQFNNPAKRLDLPQLYTCVNHDPFHLFQQKYHKK
jgi:hypothetical protein